jgi:pimeloyl-ACP methyl ester carboxylesterase
VIHSLPQAERESTLPQGSVRYRESGEGPPIVFVHGILVNGLLWRKVVPLLEGSFRCVVPDWPLGSHTIPMAADADLSPAGLADIVAGFLEERGLEKVTLVGNDTGGAICQVVAARRPERLGRLVLTPCDAYEDFPPKMFRYLQWAAQVPGGLTVLSKTLTAGPARRLPFAYGRLAKRPLDIDLVRAWIRPAKASAEIRRDVGKVLRGISPHYTLQAARKLRDFDRPVLLAWCPEDRVFPMDHARRLAEDIPTARLELVDDSWTYVPEDRPDRLAELIRDFAGR